VATDITLAFALLHPGRTTGKQNSLPAWRRLRSTAVTLIHEKVAFIRGFSWPEITLKFHRNKRYFFEIKRYFLGCVTGGLRGKTAASGFFWPLKGLPKNRASEGTQRRCCRRAAETLETAMTGVASDLSCFIVVSSNILSAGTLGRRIELASAPALALLMSTLVADAYDLCG
jgi:hypothetical protein